MLDQLVLEGLPDHCQCGGARSGGTQQSAPDVHASDAVLRASVRASVAPELVV